MPIAADLYVAEAEQVADRRRSDPTWARHAREAALERFQSVGFPTTRDEEWRFTNVAPIAESQFVLPNDGASTIALDDLATFHLSGTAATLVFVNGRYAPRLSALDRLPPGARAGSLTAAMSGPAADRVEAHLGHVAPATASAFTALNTAFLEDGAVISIDDSIEVDLPIHLLFVTTGPAEAGPYVRQEADRGRGGRLQPAHSAMTHPRVLILAGANSGASVVESYVSLGADRYLTNAVTEIAVGEGAALAHYKVQREHPDSFHVGSLYARSSAGSTLSCSSIALGGSLVRNDVVAVLDGEGATATLDGLYLSDGARLVDNHTTIDHARPHCGSRELYKGIVAGHAKAVFNGKIIVRPDAQKTDARQTNKALLLSEDAQVNTKPQLEIFANDVRCTHGAAVGQIDDEAIFYLRARGIGAREARHILVRAFADDVLNRIALDPLRAMIDVELARQLPGRR